MSILSSLRHNRIVSLYDYIEGQDYLHLVSQLDSGVFKDLHTAIVVL